MPVFDRISLVGTPSTQALVWRSAVYRVQTATLALSALASIAVPNNSVMACEVYLEGRQSASGTNLTEFERGCFLVKNVSGTLTVTSMTTLLSVLGGFYVYSSSPNNTAFLSAVSSGTNLLVEITPKSANQTDWSAWIDTSIV